MTTNTTQTEQAFIKAQQAKKQGGEGFGGKKGDRIPPQQVAHPDQVDSTESLENEDETAFIASARQDAEKLANQSHQTIAALQSSGLEEAAAFIREQTIQREKIIAQVSDAIAALTDPLLLESAIMSAAKTKVVARSGWKYKPQPINYNELFAIPVPSKALPEGE